VAITVNRSDRFPVGTSVGAYPRAAHIVGGHPAGAAVETHVVAADGSCGPFTLLAADQQYVLYALVEGASRYLDVEDSSFTAPPTGLIERIDERRAAAGVE
jgi:hypothetical protein